MNVRDLLNRDLRDMAELITSNELKTKRILELEESLYQARIATEPDLRIQAVVEASDRFRRAVSPLSDWTPDEIDAFERLEITLECLRGREYPDAEKGASA